MVVFVIHFFQNFFHFDRSLKYIPQLLADGRFHSIVNEKKAKTDAQKRAIAKWEDKFKQRIIRLTPEKDAALVKCTEENGKSVNAMLNRLVDKEIEKKLK